VKGMIDFLSMEAQAGGNVALAIFLVVSTNVLGAFITPMTLSLFVKAGSVTLPVGDLVAQLVGTIFAPLVVGKALQELPFGDHYVKKLVSRFNKPLTMLSNTLLACIPWMKVSDSAQKGTFRIVRTEDVFAIGAWFLCMHLLFLVSDPHPSTQLSPCAGRACMS
jgi:predicted Na+-dependent transporter